MPDSPLSVPDSAARFLENYLNCLIKAAIPEKQRRWCVKRVEAFIKAQNGQKIKGLSSTDIDRYFEVIGRNNRLMGWQYQQCITAIRILYCDLLKTQVCQDVAWDAWIDSARQLEIDHPTIARQLTPEELSYLKERKGNGPINEVRRTHRDLLVRFATEIRRRGYAYRTEQSYEQWICRFILFCKNVSPETVGASEVKAYLDYLVLQRKVSASTQNQALNALVFLYKQVLGQALGELEAFARSKKSKKLPVVLSRQEVTDLIVQLNGLHKLIVALLYGTGMRVLEGLRLRIQDIDFEYQRIYIHQSKGKKDRYVPLPISLIDELRSQIKQVEKIHARDVEAGYGEVILPGALSRKYPNAGRELRWQFLFPSVRLAVDPHGGAI